MKMRAGGKLYSRKPAQHPASALLGGLGLTLFGHGRILAVVLIAAAILTSTVVADLLQHGRWRVPAPWLRRLLGEPASR